MRPMLWSSKEAEEATGSSSPSVWEARGISIDTRTIEPGDLFFALKGENSDGHEYVRQAFEKGAVAAIVSDVPEGLNEFSPVLVVKDTMESLVEMAKYRRNQADNTKFIAVTGSVGKTTVKDGLTKILADYGGVHSTVGNLNNHIGLPLSLVRMPVGKDFGIFELGMSASGEISILSKIVRPNISIITAIEPMHIEFFDSVDDIARAKSEIFDGMDEGGIAVIPSDSEQFDIILREVKERGIEQVLSFGRGSYSNLLLNSEKDDNRVQDLEVLYDTKKYHYKISIFGKHQALNSLAIFATAIALDLDLNKFCHSMKKFSSSEGRGMIREVKFGDKTFTLIDDSYNAGPASMRASFEVLSAVANKKNSRKVILLGDMLELGEGSIKYHEELSVDIEKNNINLVLTVGEYMASLSKKLPDSINMGNFSNIDDCLEKFSVVVENNDVVLVKGSNGSKMWQIVKNIEGA